MDVPSRIGPYLILDWLGRGTTGSVYKARVEHIDRVVALKSPFTNPPEERAQRAKRFTREAHLIASLNQSAVPAVPCIFDVGEGNDGTQYYTRELIAGETLERLVNARRIAWSDGIRILQGVANVLVAVHAIGFIHRNLHPSNILIEPTGDFKLIGFGKAMYLEYATTQGLSIAIDVQGLMTLLSWFCAAVPNPNVDALKSARDPGFAVTVADFASALSTWLQDAKGK